MNDTASLRAEATRLHRVGQLEAAERLYRQILAADAADLETQHMLGVLWIQQGRAAEALAILDAVARAAPHSADVRSHRGLALDGLGRRDEALADFRHALALRPGHAMASFHRANLLWRGGQAEEAAADYERAVAADPENVAALFNLAGALMRLTRYDEAFAAYERVRTLSPDNPYALGGAAGAVLGGCDLARWDAYRGLLTAAVVQKSAVIAPLTFLAFCDDPAVQRTCSEVFAADRVAAAAPLWDGELHVHDRTRIAYLSADFRQHATADLIARLIERHDRKRFEVTGISFGRDDASPMRARLEKAFDHFLDVRDKSDQEVARMLRNAEIDIAVDLKGHTEDSRPGVLAHRPCPVQVGYLGYPGTIGAPWLDYILADATVLPLDQQIFYSEQIVHLPHCYQVNDDTRPIAAAPTRAAAGLPRVGFVFCCFNAAWKISPTVFDIWMRLLVAVPGSALWLLDDNKTATRNLKAAAAARGIDPAYLVFAPRVPSAEHLARHALADLFLDTLPYNAHTTASDALWAGLPLITCMGKTFPSRVAASLLTAVCLPELITHSLEKYETLALALARDPARLAALRQKLADNKATAPLFDTGLFCRNIEAAYDRMIAAARPNNRERT